MHHHKEQCLHGRGWKFVDVHRVQGWENHSLFCRRLRNHLSRGPESLYLLCSQPLPYKMLCLVWIAVPVSHQSTKVSLSHSYPSLEQGTSSPLDFQTWSVNSRRCNHRNQTVVTCDYSCHTTCLVALVSHMHTRTLGLWGAVHFKFNLNANSITLQNISTLQKCSCQFLIRTHRRQCSFFATHSRKFQSKNLQKFENLS